jgi:glucose dehydrogenase
VADAAEAPDVCIVGAGAAGGIMALELARRGISVAVLESGPRHDFARRPERVRRLLRGEDPWATETPGLDAYTTGGGAPDPLERNRARGVGGSTLHWEGYALRMHADDFRLRTLYGVADDWPLGYGDLEPYYVRAEAALGVAGADDDPWASPRSAPFPLPAFPFSYSDGLFERACRDMGVSIHHLPQARNSIPYGGRAQCRACATCHVCPTGAKASVDLTHIPRAEATGLVSVRAGATALRLDLGPAGHIDHVVYAGPDRREHRMAARLFVLAAGAVENPRLLQLSATRDHARGIGDRSGLLGRYFVSHPVIDVTGRLHRPSFPHRVGFSTAMSRQFAVGGDRARRGAFLLEFLNTAGSVPAAIAAASSERGAALRAQVRAEYGRTVGVRIYCEPLPHRDSSVTLDRQAVDYFGNPAPHVTPAVQAYERDGLREAQGFAIEILRAMDAVDIAPGPLRFSGHQIGTHRMGADPATSVVDADLRSHEIANLYLVGSGSFVTATASHPTLTIAALAIRAAEHIALRLRPAAGPGKLTAARRGA